jgi:hypothetical protein
MDKSKATAAQKKAFAPGPPVTAGRHVFAPSPRRAVGGPIGRGDFPNALLQGSTANFNVYYDPTARKRRQDHCQWRSRFVRA